MTLAVRLPFEDGTESLFFTVGLLSNRRHRVWVAPRVATRFSGRSLARSDVVFFFARFGQ